MSKFVIIIVMTCFSFSLFSQEKGAFIDKRDNQTYEWVKIGAQVWMTENMDYQTSDSYCYENEQTYCKTYGRLYTWGAAKKACPAGWHLPSDDDWDVLEKYLGFNSAHKLKNKTLWTSSGNGPNEYGFSALPGGFRDSSNDYMDLGYGGHWWSSTKNKGAYIWGRSMGYNTNRLIRKDFNKIWGLGVRCVRDE